MYDLLNKWNERLTSPSSMPDLLEDSSRKLCFWRDHSLGENGIGTSDNNSLASATAVTRASCK